MTCEAITSLSTLQNLTIETGFNGETGNIISIVIDGVQYDLTAAIPAQFSMQDLVTLINSSPSVASKIVATIEMNADASSAQLVLRAIDNSITNISIINDLSFVANFGPDNITQNLTGVNDTVSTDLVQGGTIRKLEPKTATPALNEVYVPLHTEIISDPPAVSADYWMDVHSVNPTSAIHIGSVIASKHLDTGEDIVLTSYVDTDTMFVGVDVRYANGSKAGHIVTSGYGTSGRFTFNPLALPWFDTYFFNGQVLSASMAMDPVDSTVYMKLILGGNLFADETNPSTSFNNSCVVVCSLGKRLGGVEWARMMAYEHFDGVPNGYGTHQRSERGFMVDASHNIYMANNLINGSVDAYWGTLTVTPAVEVVKMTSTGTVVWKQFIDSTTYTSTADGTITNVDGLGGYTYGAGAAWSLPANLDVAADGSVFVAHGTLIHKLSSTGNPVYAKNFWDLSLNQYGVSYVTDIQVHKTTGKVYVVITGMSPHGYGNRYGLIEMLDNPDGGISNRDIWMSPSNTQNIDPWGNGTQWLYPPAVMKLDSSTNTAYIATVFSYHGTDNYNQTPAGDFTVLAVDVSAGSIKWSQDLAMSAYETFANEVYLDAPVPIHWHTEYPTGSTSFDVVHNSAGSATELLYTSTLYTGEGNPTASAVFGVSPSTPINTTSAANSVVNYALTVSTTADINTAHTLAAAGFELTSFDPGTSTIVPAPTSYTRSVTAPNVAITNLMTTFVSHLYMLPPFSANVTPSLYVENIARVGELQLGGLFNAPTTTVGMPTDKRGAVRADSSMLYYCTADYDGSTDIWKSVPFGAAGGKIKLEAPGFNPQQSTIAGCPSDRVGDIYITSDVVLVCTAAYDGTNEIWSPLLPSFGQGITVTQNKNFAYDSSDSVHWPNGAKLTDYSVTLSVPPSSVDTMYTVTSAPTTIYVYPSSAGSVYYSTVTSGMVSIYFYDYYWAYPHTFKITFANRGLTPMYIIQPPSYGYMDGWTRVIPANTTRTYMSSPSGQLYMTESKPTSVGSVTIQSYQSPAITPDNGEKQILYVSNNYTLPNPTSLESFMQGMTINLTIIMQGNYTLSFGSMYRFSGGTAPTAPASGRALVIHMTYTPNGTWLCEYTNNVSI